MWRIPGLIAVVLALSGCTTSVLETWRDPLAPHLPSERTLVVAAVGEPYRAAVEDALVRGLPGTAASHVQPEATESLRWVNGEPTRNGFASRWDAVIVAKVQTTDSWWVERPQPENCEYEGLSTDCLPFQLRSVGFQALVLEVTVYRLSGEFEVCGTTVQQEGKNVRQVHDLAPKAAARAATELRKLGILE